ncbi:MAG: AmmeMemoRadiSam system protein B [Deltaproteobacteria bacterium]|nr:AmmeMemoRadiSam system protein B [Deltaproteobacteria bacterium]
MLRRTCVAGQFYPGVKAELEKDLRGFLSPGGAAENCVALISPHAGYIYSGRVAGAVYSSVRIPGNIVLIGPNHTGAGKRASLMASGQWETPLGRLCINEELAGLILGSSPIFSDDMAAHLREHSLEVQLPFIYTINREASFVPITLMHAGFKECLEMGLAIAKAIKAYRKETIIAVSSDMNHYEDEKKTRAKDKLAIDMALKLDAKGLLDVTEEKDITMCGVVPTAAAIAAAKELGATTARLIKYSTSGETSGDLSHVVGYAGIIIQ